MASGTRVRGSIPGLATTIPEIGCFLLQSRDITERRHFLFPFRDIVLYCCCVSIFTQHHLITRIHLSLLTSQSHRNIILVIPSVTRWLHDGYVKTSQSRVANLIKT